MMTKKRYKEEEIKVIADSPDMQKPRLSGSDTYSEMPDFGEILKKFEKEEIEKGNLIVWIHYYGVYPVALMGILLEYLPPRGEKNEDLGSVQLEALDSKYYSSAVGFVEANAILPVIFGDDPNFQNHF